MHKAGGHVAAWCVCSWSQLPVAAKREGFSLWGGERGSWEPRQMVSLCLPTAKRGQVAAGTKFTPTPPDLLLKKKKFFKGD